MLLVNGIGAAYWLPKAWRSRIYRACGFDIGPAVVIFSGCIIRCLRLRIGAGSFVNHRCLFDTGEIIIGRDVFVSSGVTLASNDHQVGGPDKRAGAGIERPIVIEDGVWVGAGVTVLGDVRIARGCIIGAGAVVTRDTDPDGVYVGVPARRIRDLADDQLR